MSEEAQIHLRLSADKKRKWQQYVEESNEATTLSHLIRLSVSRQIAGDNDLDETQQGSVPEGLDDQLDGIQTDINALRGDVRTLLQAREQEDVSELVDQIYESIPRVGDEDEWVTRLKQMQQNDNGLRGIEVSLKGDCERELVMVDEEAGTGWLPLGDDYVTVEELAGEFDESEYRVQLAVDRLQESFARVSTRTEGGVKYVYEVV